MLPIAAKIEVERTGIPGKFEKMIGAIAQTEGEQDRTDVCCGEQEALPELMQSTCRRIDPTTLVLSGLWVVLRDHGSRFS